MAGQIYLKDFVKILRSKNAGPFEMTIDIIFKSKEDFEYFMSTGVLTKELVSKLYHLPVEKIITFEAYPAANAFKITLPRHRSQGSIGETDMHAAQQYAPVCMISFPAP